MALVLSRKSAIYLESDDDYRKQMLCISCAYIAISNKNRK